MPITQFTTPKNTFDVDIDLTDAAAIWITYSQNDKEVFTKTKEDIEFISPKTMRVTLTQEETGKLDILHQVEIQIRARFPDETAIATDIVKTPVQKVLKPEVI